MHIFSILLITFNNLSTIIYSLWSEIECFCEGAFVQFKMKYVGTDGVLTRSWFTNTLIILGN